MAAIRKIKGSLVNIDVDDYIGEFSYLFYDIETGSLRIFDGTPGGLPIAKPLTELTDVVITNPGTAQVLTYSGTAWINSPPASGSTILTTTNKSTDYTATVSDDIIMVTGTTTITLPLAATITGKVFYIKSADSAIKTIITTNSETIDDELAMLLSEPYTSITVVSDGVKWHII